MLFTELPQCFVQWYTGRTLTGIIIAYTINAPHVAQVIAGYRWSADHTLSEPLIYLEDILDSRPNH